MPRKKLPIAKPSIADGRNAPQAPSTGSRIYCTATFDPHKPRTPNIFLPVFIDALLPAG